MFAGKIKYSQDGIGRIVSTGNGVQARIRDDSSQVGLLRAPANVVEYGVRGRSACHDRPTFRYTA